MTGILESLLAAFPDLGDRHIFEIAAVLTHRKRVVRVVTAVKRVQAMATALNELGLYVALPRVAHAVERETSLGDRFTTTVPYGDPSAVEAALVASLDRAVAETALDIDEKGSACDAGEIYEYPACCIEAYHQLNQGRDWLDPLIDSARSSHCNPHYLSNKLAYLFDGASLLPDYFPCSLHCTGALALAQRLRAAALECGLAHRVNAVETALKQPIVLWRGHIFQGHNNRDDGHSVAVNGNKGLHCWRPCAPNQDFVFQATSAHHSLDGIVLHTPTLSCPPDPSGLIIRWKL